MWRGCSLPLVRGADVWNSSSWTGTTQPEREHAADVSGGSSAVQRRSESSPRLVARQADIAGTSPGGAGLLGSDDDCQRCGHRLAEQRVGGPLTEDTA